MDNKFPWKIETGSNRNWHSRNVWFSEAYQQTRNNNLQPFNIWSAGQENSDSKNLQGSRLFVDSIGLSSAIGSSREKQCKSENFQNDQSVTFQNTFNAKWPKRSQKFNSFRISRKKNLKRNRSKRVLRQILSYTYDIPSHVLKQDHQGSNIIPILESSHLNLPSKSFKTNSQKSRPGFSNEYNKNLYRSRDSTRSNFINTSSNFSDVASESDVQRANFKSRNILNNYSGGAMVNVSHRSSILNDSNRLPDMDSKRWQINSTTSTNFENSIDEDVTYLYSVDSSSEGKMILEVDLQSDGVQLIPDNCSSTNDNSAQKSKTEDVTEHESIINVEQPELAVPLTSRKRKLSNNDAANKRPSYRLRCTACLLSYDSVIEKNENMYISSSCSHVFCGSCISKNGKLEVCPACEDKFLSFRRVYL